jgi:hypothetical protein
MYVTEHLPSSTYDTDGNPLNAFGQVTKKRSTLEPDRAKKKRLQSNDDGTLTLNSGEPEYKNYKRGLKAKPLKDEDSDNQTSIIQQIIKVKQDIDSELSRMGAPEQIPRALERRKRRKNMATERLREAELAV